MRSARGAAPTARGSTASTSRVEGGTGCGFSLTVRTRPDCLRPSWFDSLQTSDPPGIDGCRLDDCLFEVLDESRGDGMMDLRSRKDAILLVDKHKIHASAALFAIACGYLKRTC